jgi:hypothetical protein
MLNTNIPLSQAAEEILKKLMSLNPDQWKEQIPFSRAGDELWSYLSFKQRHGRAPTNKMLFNDVLYRIKTSDEILNILQELLKFNGLTFYYVQSLNHFYDCQKNQQY